MIIYSRFRIPKRILALAVILWRDITVNTLQDVLPPKPASLITCKRRRWPVPSWRGSGSPRTPGWAWPRWRGCRCPCTKGRTLPAWPGGEPRPRPSKSKRKATKETGREGGCGRDPWFLRDSWRYRRQPEQGSSTLPVNTKKNKKKVKRHIQQSSSFHHKMHEE